MRESVDEAMENEMLLKVVCCVFEKRKGAVFIVCDLERGKPAERTRRWKKYAWRSRSSHSEKMEF